MAHQLLCSEGHAWLAADDEPGRATSQLTVCPVCGRDPERRHEDPGATAVFSEDAPGAATIQQENETALPGSDVDVVPGYEIVGVLGRGGMGVVYWAEQTALKRPVALKMVLAGQHAGPAALTRFQNEAEAVARLQHPNIVQIYEVGCHQNLPYFSLEYVSGGSLAQFLSGTPQPSVAAAKLIADLARAVHFAHQHGIVHRDLKPANILLRGGRESPDRPRPSGDSRPSLADYIPKITDFGLAKNMEADDHQTQTGTLLGTPSYMAPEQARGRSRDIGPAADVYALGAVLYELLTGRPPFRGSTFMETAQQVLIHEPVPPARLQPNVARDLETICLKCLQKEPGRRYDSAQALADDLQRFLGHEAILARPAGPAERLGKWARRRPALAGLVAVSAAAVLLLLAGGIWFTVHLQRERDRAQHEHQRAEASFHKTLEAVNKLVNETVDNQLFQAPHTEKIRRFLLETALTVHQELLQEKGEDLEVRKKTSLASKRVADLHRHLGHVAEAEQAYQQAIDLLQPLARELPHVAELQDRLAESYTWQGELWRSAGRLQDAQQAFHHAQKIQEDLARRHPEPTYRRNLRRGRMNLGLVYKDTNKLPEALRAFAQAIEVLEDLNTAQGGVAGYRQELAKCLLNLGSAERQAGNGPAAAVAFGRAIDLLEDLLREDKGKPDYRYELAVAYSNRANFSASRPPEKGSDYLQAAEQDYRRALELWQHLVSDFARVPGFRSEQANTWNGLAALLVRRKEYSQAHDVWARARTNLETLVEEFPDRVNYESDLSMVLGNLAWVSGKQDRWHDARTLLEEAVPRVQAALKHSPKNTHLQQLLRSQYQQLANTLIQLNDHQEAARIAWLLPTAYRQDKDDYVLAATLLGRCLALAEKDTRLGDSKKEKCRATYEQQAIEALRQAIGRGYNQLERLDKEPAFAELRRLAAFKQLRQELKNRP